MNAPEKTLALSYRAGTMWVAARSIRDNKEVLEVEGWPLVGYTDGEIYSSLRKFLSFNLNHATGRMAPCRVILIDRATRVTLRAIVEEYAATHGIGVSKLKRASCVAKVLADRWGPALGGNLDHHYGYRQAIATMHAAFPNRTH